MLRGSGNTLCPEGRQGARIEWVWRTCPPKWAKGMRKPLQDEAHSTQRVRKWERWEEASAGWAARGSGAVEMGKVRRNREGPEAATCSKMADLKWRLLLAVFRIKNPDVAQNKGSCILKTYFLFYSTESYQS